MRKNEYFSRRNAYKKIIFHAQGQDEVGPGHEKMDMEDVYNESNNKGKIS